MAKVKYYLRPLNLTDMDSIDFIPQSISMPVNTEFVTPRRLDGLSVTKGAAMSSILTGAVGTGASRDLLLGVFRFEVPVDKQYTWVGHTDNSFKIKLALGKQTTTGGAATNEMSVIPVMYVYDPISKALIGFIQDSSTAMSGNSQNDWPATASSVCAVGTLSGSSTVSVPASAGQWIVLELWGKRSQTNANYSIMIDGTDDTLADGDTGGDYASYIEVDETILDFSGGGGEPTPPPAGVAGSKVLVLNFLEDDPSFSLMAYGAANNTKINCVSESPINLDFGLYTVLLGCGDPSNTAFGFVLGQQKQLYKWPTVPSNYAIDQLGDGTDNQIDCIYDSKFICLNDPITEKYFHDVSYTFESAPASVATSEVSIFFEYSLKREVSDALTNLGTLTYGSWSSAYPQFFEKLFFVNKRARYIRFRVTHRTLSTGNKKGRMFFSGLYVSYTITNTRRTNIV